MTKEEIKALLMQGKTEEEVVKSMLQADGKVTKDIDWVDVKTKMGTAEANLLTLINEITGMEFTKIVLKNGRRGNVIPKTNSIEADEKNSGALSRFFKEFQVEMNMFDPYEKDGKVKLQGSIWLNYNFKEGGSNAVTPETRLVFDIESGEWSKLQ